MKTLIAASLLLFTASPANASWLYSGGEGSYYAYNTDGGFVEGSFQNGIKVSCSDDRDFCTLRIWIDGELPQPPVVVTFKFASGKTLMRQAEAPGGTDPVVGFDGEIQEALKSENNVTVSVPRVGSYTFSLSGSSAAIKSAMDD